MVKYYSFISTYEILDYFIRHQINLRPYQLVFTVHSFRMHVKDKNERKV